MTVEEMFAELNIRLNGIADVPQRLDEISRRMEAGQKDAKAERLHIMSRQDTTNGRLREVELDQAKMEGGIHVLKWMLGVALAIPTSVLAVGGFVVLIR